MLKDLRLLPLILAACLTAIPAFAAVNFASNSLGSAPYVSADLSDPAPPASTSLDKALIDNANPFLEMRYRYETVHQDGVANDGNANTLRTILGYQTGSYKGFSIAVAGENVAHFGATNYNDGINNKAGFPKIGDPNDTLLQLGNLTYTGLPNTSFTVGRQYLNLDNQRFIGTSNWRQIRQNFDAVTAKHSPLPGLELFYSFIFDVNRSPGTHSTTGTYQMHTHAMHATYTGLKDIKLSAYTYLEDIRNQPTLSNNTMGVRAEVQHKLRESLIFTGVGEYARQSNFGNNNADYGLNYYTVEPGARWSALPHLDIIERVGYEVLEGNSHQAVQTPLAALHPQNGWADLFATTPSKGLEDMYVSTTLKYQLPIAELAPTKIQGDWHSYHSNVGGLHYGNEVDLDFSQLIYKHYTVEVQFADYHADQLLTDTRKIMLMGMVQY